MPEFEKPTFVTEDGTKVIVAADADGIHVRSRTAMGSDSVAHIRAEVAWWIAENADSLIESVRERAAPTDREAQTITADDIGVLTVKE